MPASASWPLGGPVLRCIPPRDDLSTVKDTLPRVRTWHVTESCSPCPSSRKCQGQQVSEQMLPAEVLEGHALSSGFSDLAQTVVHWGGKVRLISHCWKFWDGDSACSTSGTFIRGVGDYRQCHSLSKLPSTEHPAPQGLSL